jgi:hypothetical protein
VVVRRAPCVRVRAASGLLILGAGSGAAGGALLIRCSACGSQMAVQAGIRPLQQHSANHSSESAVAAAINGERHARWPSENGAVDGAHAAGESIRDFRDAAPCAGLFLTAEMLSLVFAMRGW